MKMIVGLGNPGQKYVGTRHNIGFEVVGQFAKQNYASTPRLKFESEYSEINIGETKVILLCPLTYMNLSGQGVSQAASFFRVHPKDILVVCDDFNLSMNRVRFKPSGSAGGQNGLNDIIKRLGTKDFPRLRVGIGPVPEKWNPADFVLGKFTDEENAQIKQVIDQCVLGLKVWVTEGIDLCMNRFNSVNRENATVEPAKKKNKKQDSDQKKVADEENEHTSNRPPKADSKQFRSENSIIDKTDGATESDASQDNLS